MNIIECNEITHYYGNRLIYEDLSFNVEKGKILGLLGKNGTGKTTIINILNGYLEPKSGNCKLFGEDMRDIKPKTKAKVGLLLEGHVQHTYFDVIQIEKYYSQFYPKWNKDAYFELIKKLKISQKQKISTMSCGQRSQVVLGLLFAQNPELLILDDFSMGLDPGYRRLFVEYLKEFAIAENKTVFLTSHIIQDMELLIDDCMILDYGRILLHKPTSDIMNGFLSYTIESEKEKLQENKRLIISEIQKPFSDDVFNTEIVDGELLIHSFLKENVLTSLLEKLSLKIKKSNKMSLEDAFISLTGKY